VKIVLPRGAALDAVSALVQRHGARLSQNANARRADGGEERLGLSRSGQHKWRTFEKRHPGAPTLLEARERVQGVVVRLIRGGCA
jgi:hypothetical protein